MGRSRPTGRQILREKDAELIDGTSVMVQPSISRTYTFIIYYPCRYGYFASGTFSRVSLFLLFFLLVLSSRCRSRCIGKVQRPTVTKQRSRYRSTYPRTRCRVQSRSQNHSREMLLARSKISTPLEKLRSVAVKRDYAPRRVDYY